MNKKKPIISISSPTRSDTSTSTFPPPPPPPLMTFLRTNFGNKSTRSRKQRSRLIFRRTRRLTTTAAEAEPSSPKVTCIGQVKSSKTTPSRRRRFRVSKSPVLCCRWIVKVKVAMLCFSNYCRKLTCKLLRKCVRLSCHDQSSEQNRTEQISPKLESRTEVRSSSVAEEITNQVPMNAFLLTRCKSASSSLVLSSSKTEAETEDGETETKDEEGSKVHVREDNRTLGMEQRQRDSTPESKRDRESLKLCENRGTVVLLKRCKSEPGRVMERLVSDPELDLRVRRKSEF